MNETRTSPKVIRFGPFEVDLRAGELRKHGIRIKIQEQPLQVLGMLLERPGDVVTREELRMKLWPVDTFVDFDHGLNSAINKLREALGDSADTPRFIETLPRRGYRFIGAVESVAAHAGQTGTPVPPGARGLSPDTVGAPATGALAPEADVVAAEAAKPRPRYGLLAFIGLAALSVAILGLNIDGVRERLFGKPVAPRIQSIAVLPLENLSKDPEQEYFADGMTDELIAELAKISALRVISRTSVMQYKGVKKLLPQVAQELGVDAVVEGTVLRSGERVRVTANLVQPSPEKHLWSESYERDLRDVLVLQSDVASAIAREIQIKVSPQEQARLASSRPVNPEAYELYLRGRFYWERFTPESLTKSIGYFNQAIQKDPSYALAYIGLAHAYVNLAGRAIPPTEAMPKAKVAAQHALESDSNLGEAHTSSALVKIYYDYDWSGAESEYKRAIELSPGYSLVHTVYGLYLAARGRSEESLKEVDRAHELDPLSLIPRGTKARLLYYAHRHDEAIEEFKKTLEMDPRFESSLVWLGLTYQQKSMFAEAVSQLQKAVSASPNENLPMGALARAYAMMGREDEARKIIMQLEELSKKRYVSPYEIAVAYTGLGDKDQAMAWLEKSHQARIGLLVYLNVDPVFDPLRSDPRFQDLLRRIGLPP